MNPYKDLKYIFDRAGELVLLVSALGVIKYKNYAAKKCFSLVDDYADTESLTDYLAEPDRMGLINNLQSLSEGKSNVKFEIDIRKGPFRNRRLQAYGHVCSDASETKGILLFFRDITNIMTTTFNLREREKELFCVSELLRITESEKDLESLFAELLPVLKNGWLYPDLTEFRIRFDDIVRQTDNFRKTDQMMQESIVINDRQQGSIEVSCFKEMPNDETVFLKEEYQLLNLVARQLENTLLKRRQDQNYAELLNVMNEAILKVDAEGRITEANRAAAKICGYRSCAELEGQLMNSLYPDRKQRTALLQEIIKQGGQINNYEFLLRQKDGSTIWTLCNIRLNRDKNGTITDTIGVFRDISDYKNANYELEKRNAEVQSLLKGTRSVLCQDSFQQTAEKIFSYCKTTIGATAGYVALLNENGEENDVLFLDPGGMPCNVDPELPMPIRGLREVVYANGKASYDNKYPVSDHVKYMPEGHIPLKNVMFAPIKENGRTIGLLGLGEKEGGFNDYDAKLASSYADLVAIALINSKNLEKLKLSHQRYKRLLDNSGAIIIEADIDTYEIISCNALAGEYLGDKPEKLTGKNLKNYLPDEAFRIRKEFALKAVSRNKVLHFEDERNGRYFSHSFIPIELNKRKHIQTISHDITHIKEAEALIKSEARLRELNKTKDKFFSIISHDLKNPLGTLYEFSSFVLKAHEDGNYDKAYRYDKQIHHSLKHTYSLLENLLHWARLQRGTMAYKPQVVKLRNIADELAAFLEAGLLEKTVHLTVDIPENIKLFADRFMLESLLRNLLTNAIKYSLEGGNIILQALYENKEVLIQIKDKGVGMKPEKLAGLFKLESNVSTPGTHNEKGTGLGLILCKEFVEKHGGRIIVESELGKGSIFSVYLPNRKSN